MPPPSSLDWGTRVRGENLSKKAASMGMRKWMEESEAVFSC